jgi:aspartyl-tRNA(Asn)/glutamyl-tRNA(Gln) amidotransferase subunit A
MNSAKVMEELKNRKIKMADLVKYFIDKIKREDKDINSFLEVFEKSAMEKAIEIDRKIENNIPTGRLAGLVIAIKDNMLYKGHEITCASKMLKGHISAYNSTVVEKLLLEDAVIIGRTNMDEFAMGSSTENSAYKKTKNPINISYAPGGSSGGSAASVKAGFCHVALGTDTGGSVRQPASFCGIYALKPTYGRVSRYGLVAFASSLDQIGPMANNLEDLKLVFDIIKGYDKKDSTSIYNPELRPIKEINEITIGIPELIEDGEVEADLASAFDELISRIKNKVKIKKINLPNLKYALPAYYILASSEASSNLARFDGIRYGLNVGGDDINDLYRKNRGAGFGSEVKRRILLGTHSLSSGYYDAYYLKAQKIRNLIKRDFDKAFENCDSILMPTSPTAAFKLGEKIDNPIAMYMSDIFTIPVNMAGICSLTAPYGKRKNDEMPYGFQFIGPAFSDEMIIDIAGKLIS